MFLLSWVCVNSHFPSTSFYFFVFPLLSLHFFFVCLILVHYIFTICSVLLQCID